MKQRALPYIENLNALYQKYEVFIKQLITLHTLRNCISGIFENKLVVGREPASARSTSINIKKLKQKLGYIKGRLK